MGERVAVCRVHYARWSMSDIGLRHWDHQMYGPVAFSDGAAVFFRYFKLPITCAKMLEVPVIIKIVLNLLSIESNCTRMSRRTIRRCV